LQPEWAGSVQQCGLYYFHVPLICLFGSDDVFKTRPA
jgi:hypothetical protein